MNKAKQYPDSTLENALRDAGIPVTCLWQLQGKSNDGWAWLECLNVNGYVFMVQTYKGGGWEVYRPSRTNSVTETIKEVAKQATGLDYQF